MYNLNATSTLLIIEVSKSFKNIRLQMNRSSTNDSTCLNGLSVNHPWSVGHQLVQFVQVLELEWCTFQSFECLKILVALTIVSVLFPVQINQIRAVMSTGSLQRREEKMVCKISPTRVLEQTKRMLLILLLHCIN